jgi:2-oxoglutarate dehydrogenase E2 component (dihydrolipoamide succinyltransferase)
MIIEVKVPTLPESVADGTLINWHKKPGDPVRQDENLVDLETDKVVLEIPSPAEGILGEILRSDGETVTTGDVIARIDEAAVESAATPAEAPRQGPATAPAESQPTGAAPAEAASSTVVALESLSPAVRRLAQEHKLDVSKIPGSGRSGRVTKADVLAYLDSRNRAETATAATPAPSPPSPPVAAPVPKEMPSTPAIPPDSRGRLEQRVPMTRLRARIAERLVEAQHTAAMLTTFNEVNMQPIMDIRGRYRDRFEKLHGIRLGIMSFFVKAVIEALRRFPAVNGSIDGNDIIYHGYYDIGIAVASPRGLVVPILRDAEHLSFADIEKAIADFGKRAQEGSLSMEDLTGGTFSITNGGVFGSLMSTPILNPPQSAILGMHKVMDRAMVEHGQMVARPMMYLALTYDHRIIDGREAVSFLVTVKECIEDPARLLLQI